MTPNGEDHVAVLRDLRENLGLVSEEKAALDYAIKAAERDAELRALPGKWRSMDYDGWRADEAFGACADAIDAAMAGKADGGQS